MAKQRIGYRRVSTAIQKTDRQLADVELDRVFTDKASGSTIERPELDRLLAAKAKGVRFGRPPSLGKNEINEVREQYAVGKSVTAIAMDFDLSRQSVYRALGAEKR